ncbi:MAG: DinB family protein [Actinomycetota bacterium]|nr:DinB family protein [Actinomycetota bacterium]
MSIERTDPPYAGTESEQLFGFLDYHRATLLMKCDGLDAEQLNRTLAPSAMTLGGMLKHLALVEASWFSDRFAGNDEAEPWASVDWKADWDWDWHSAADDTPEELRALLEENVARSREAVVGADLDAMSARPTRRGEHFSLRWIVLHMIEEYARHNGHADLLRESIDGVTGE